MCMGVLPAYVYAPCACSAHEGQKRALRALGLDLNTVETFQVVAGERTWVLWQNSYQLTHLSSPKIFIFPS